MANEITAAELVANVRAKMDMLPADMAKAEGIVKGAAKKMNSGAGTAGSGVGAAMGKGIQTGLSSFLGGGAGMLLAGGIAGGLALIAKEAIGAAGEMAALGRQSERIGTSFVSLWGEEAPGAMERLRSASMGAISDMDLQLAANKASMLGVGSGVDDLAKLMQVAQERGRALGLTTAQAFSDIVTGIGRMSPLILDNLGIVTNAEATYGAYAESLGRAADSLTDAEKKQALVNRVTAEAGNVTADSAGQHEALQAAKANLRGELGMLIDGFITETGVVDTLTEALTRQTEALQARSERGAAIAEEQASLDNIMASMAAGGVGPTQAGEFGDLAADINRTAEQFRKGRISLVEYQDAIEGYRVRLRMLSGETYPELIQRGQNWAAAMRIQEAVTDDVAVKTAQLAEREAELASQGVAAAGGAELLAQKIGRIGSAAAEATPELRAMARAAWAAVQAEQGAYDGSAVSTAGYYTVYDDRWELEQDKRRDADLSSQRFYAAESTDIAKQQFDDMRHIIEGALSPTAVTAADLAATAAGTYVDKWDEYMRRIRMPESGLGADQIAEQERLFYSGQMMDQINWSAVVSDVGRKVQEEAGREAMVQEAMRQVAAAGIGATQSQVAAAMGVTGYAAGTGEAEQMAKGLTATGLGIQFTEQFEDEFAQQQERWVDMGALSVAWMAAGIERGTTPQVTQLLINLLLPRIEEALMGGVRP